MKRILLTIAILALLLTVGAIAQDAASVVVDIPPIERPLTAELWFIYLDYGTDALASSEEGGETVVWTRAPYIKIVYWGIDGDNESYGAKYGGVIDNNAGTVALVGATQTMMTPQQDNSWVTTITADTLNDALDIHFLAETGKDVYAVATVQLTQVTG